MPDDRPPTPPLTVNEEGEVESTLPVTRPAYAVAPVEHFKAVPPAVFQQTLDDEVSKFAMLINAIRTILVPTEDYGMVHRKLGPRENKTPCPHAREQMMYSPEGKLISCPNCGAKHTLRKGGAEKILRFVRVSVRYTIDREAADIFQAAGIQGVVPLICTGTDLESGVTVLEGKGSATLKQNDNDPNKTLKMAKKSSMIDACLGLGLSSVFTQDIDSPTDYRQDGEAAAPPAPTGPNGQPIPDDAWDRRGPQGEPGHQPAPANAPAKPAGASTGKIFVSTPGTIVQVSDLAKGDAIEGPVTKLDSYGAHIEHMNLNVVMNRPQGATEAPPWPGWFAVGVRFRATVLFAAMKGKRGDWPLCVVGEPVQVAESTPSAPTQADYDLTMIFGHIRTVAQKGSTDMLNAAKAKAAEMFGTPEGYRDSHDEAKLNAFASYLADVAASLTDEPPF